MNHIMAALDFFAIGGKRQLELFLSNDDNKSSSRADHDYDDDYYYDSEDKDDYTDDGHTANAEICFE